MARKAKDIRVKSKEEVGEKTTKVILEVEVQNGALSLATILSERGALKPLKEVLEKQLEEATQSHLDNALSVIDKAVEKAA
jgi:hypothetical protein